MKHERSPQGAKRLRDAALRRGDIILTTSSSPVSKAIRAATDSDISHAMVCVEDRSVIDATPEGVQARNTQRLFFDHGCAIYVLRPKVELTGPQLSAVERYMRGHIGAEYSAPEAAIVALGGASWMSRKQFCSRLVAQAYAHAGISLVADPNYCSPAEIKNSPLLTVVNDATETLSPEAVTAWSERPDGTQVMRDATNRFLAGARAKDGRIQTFDDVDSHLFAHPEDDSYFSDLLVNSGYLDVWKFGGDKDAWMYDLDAMRLGPADQLEPYCRRLLATRDLGPNRFEQNLAGYRRYCKRNPSIRYFKLKFDLYEILAARHQRRMDVASAWLHEFAQLGE